MDQEAKKMAMVSAIIN